MTDIDIGFSPNNFFYVDAKNDNAPYAPSSERCDGISEMEINCDHDHFMDTSFNCIMKEMCKNEKIATSIENINNNLHYEEDEKYIDDAHIYQNYFLKAVNLGIGIIALIYIMSRK
jgi:hypothetical protein